MEHLIAIKDISDSVKAGDRFDAPDRILVAIGFAMAAPDDTAPQEGEPVARRTTYRRPRTVPDANA